MFKLVKELAKRARKVLVRVGLLGAKYEMVHVDVEDYGGC